jgi:hypothetical protein
VAPGAHGLDAVHHRFEGGVDQPLGQHRRRADEIHAAGVAVPAVLDDGDVEIDDVAVLQHLAGFGMPWQITWLTELHSVLGKPW